MTQGTLFAKSGALFSEDRRFRYWLRREWDGDLPKVAFIGLNPSKADEIVNDPTVTRCINYARKWEFGGLIMLNLYAYRATDPREMWKAQDSGVNIVGGKQNEVEALKQYVKESNCDLVVAAWGTHAKDRGEFVIAQWPELHALFINKDGTPKHPLYLRADLKPQLIAQFKEQQ